ncbi:hypothetical protein, partial [Rhodococcus sp. T2V]|uniref:hypothetical protein n=1 Tax=Rhodococcus sp. T2V TaxID=3034164 RepID=UPI0023E2D402
MSVTVPSRPCAACCSGDTDAALPDAPETFWRSFFAALSRVEVIADHFRVRRRTGMESVVAFARVLRARDSSSS